MDAAQYKWADISDNMRKRWPGKHMVNVKSLQDSNKISLKDSLKKIASYPFKKRCNFNYEFGNLESERGSDDFDDINMFFLNFDNCVWHVMISKSIQLVYLQ